jgi:Transglutaminase-like superfamily
VTVELANYQHPLVRETAARVTAEQTALRGKLERLFAYVRNDIAFGFPLEGDLVKASDVIRSGQGQCNNKTTLFLALCRAADIPARIHFSLIGKEIQRGLFEGLAYWLMPGKLSHSWLEVEIDGRWRRIDAYINDPPFQEGAVKELKCRGWRTGFSVALPGRASRRQSLISIPRSSSRWRRSPMIMERGKIPPIILHRRSMAINLVN